MPALVLSQNDSIRFTLGGKPIERATLAKAKVKEIDVKPGSKPGQWDLVITLVIAGGNTTKQMDAWRFNSEAEMWGGLAEFAAGKLADLALEMHAREEAAQQAGRGMR